MNLEKYLNEWKTITIYIVLPFLHHLALYSGHCTSGKYSFFRTHVGNFLIMDHTEAKNQVKNQFGEWALSLLKRQLMTENEKIRLAYYDCICQDIDSQRVSKTCILSELQLLCEKDKISNTEKWRKIEFLHAIGKFTHF